MHKARTYNILPGTLGLLTITSIAISISNGLHYNYRQFYDDLMLVEVSQRYGVFNGTLFLFNNCNGRLFSHFLTMIILPIITSNQVLPAVFYLVNIVLFALSISWFLKRFFAYRYNVQLTIKEAITIGSLFYCMFFFFFFAKRFEFWYWLTAIFIYEYSLILILILNGILMQQSIGKMAGALVFIISLCIGLMSETQALAQMLILFFWLVGNKNLFRDTATQGKWKLVSAGLIGAGLVTNYLSPGTVHKMRISKTQVEGVSNYAHGFAIFIKDLALRWDYIILDSFRPYRLNSLVIQIACAIFLFLFLKSFNPRLFIDRKPTIPGKSIFGLLSVALIILLITYLVPTVLYANILDFILDRCKFVGCLFMFLAWFDFAVTLTSFMKEQKKQA